MRTGRTLPPLNALKAFEAAARHASFTRAAEELSVSPTAIRSHIRAMESWLGKSLFHREGNTLRLTRCSREYLPIVTAALDRLEAGAAAIRKIDRHVALSVGARPNIALRWLAPRLTRFYKECPDLRMRLVTALPNIEAIRDMVDAYILYCEDKPSRDYVFLFEPDLFPVCHLDLLQGRCYRKPQDLLKLPLIMSVGGQDDWCTWFGVAGCHFDPDNGDFPLFDTAALAVESAAQGLGVALTSGVFAADDLAAERLVVPCPIRVKKSGAYYLALPRHAEGRAQRLFSEWLMAEAQSTRNALVDLSQFVPPVQRRAG